jgi:hypothetical protein
MADRGGFMKSLMSNPATAELGKAFAGFAVAQAGNVAGRMRDKDTYDEDVDKSDEIQGGAMQGVGEATSEGKSKVWGGIKGALKGLFKTGGSAKRPTNIYEQLFIGVPVAQAYENWTEYSKFPEFMKGPESVKVSEDEEGNETHQWTAKIFLNRRSWKATVEEDVENSRIRWSTEAAKGTIDGAISFTPIGDNATLMVYTLEYRPKGFFEWWGNRWRTVGRRARLDVKHFGRYVMMQDQTSDEEEQQQPDDDEADVGDEQLAEADEAGELRSDLSEESDVESDNDVSLHEDSDSASDVAPEPEWEEPGPRRPSKPKPPRKRGESSE